MYSYNIKKSLPNKLGSKASYPKLNKQPLSRSVRSVLPTWEYGAFSWTRHDWGATSTLSRPDCTAVPLGVWPSRYLSQSLFVLVSAKGKMSKWLKVFFPFYFLTYVYCNSFAVGSVLSEGWLYVEWDFTFVLRFYNMKRLFLLLVNPLLWKPLSKYAEII